mgnify:CR=1 FL=1
MNCDTVLGPIDFEKVAIWFDDAIATFPSEEVVEAQWAMARRIENDLKGAGVIPGCSDVKTEFGAFMEDQERLQDILIYHAFRGNKKAFEEALEKEVLYQKFKPLLSNVLMC